MNNIRTRDGVPIMLPMVTANSYEMVGVFVLSFSFGPKFLTVRRNK